MFSWPRAFSWRFRATAASGLEGSLVGTRCEPPKMDPDSGPAPRRAAPRRARRVFVFLLAVLRAAATGKASPPELNAFPGIREAAGAV